MKKVFIVVAHHDYEHDQYLCAFDSEEKARAFINQAKKYDSENPEPLEHDFDGDDDAYIEALQARIDNHPADAHCDSYQIEVFELNNPKSESVVLN